MMREWQPIAPVPKQDRGKGRGAEYVPYLQPGDVKKASGRIHRPFGWKLIRVHNLFSDGEYKTFLIYQWSPIVVDIREQYPLTPIEETIAIAEELGVPIPEWNRSGEPMTTDFVVTIREWEIERHVARYFKYQNYFQDAKKARRALELAEIARRWHINHGMDWGIVTDVDLPRILVANLDLINEAYAIESVAPLTQHDIQLVYASLLPAIRRYDRPINEIAHRLDRKFGYADGMTLNVVWHLIARRRLRVNVFERIDSNEPLAILPVASKVEENPC